MTDWCGSFHLHLSCHCFSLFKTEPLDTNLLINLATTSPEDGSKWKLSLHPWTLHNSVSLLRFYLALHNAPVHVHRISRHETNIVAFVASNLSRKFQLPVELTSSYTSRNNRVVPYRVRTWTIPDSYGTWNEYPPTDNGTKTIKKVGGVLDVNGKLAAITPGMVQWMLDFDSHHRE